MKNIIKKIHLMFILIVGEIFTLILWLFIKHRIHGLSIADVNPFSTGNILIFIISIVSLVFLIFTSFALSRLELKKIQIYLSLLLTTILILMLQAVFLVKGARLIETIDSSGYEFYKVFSTSTWGIFLLIKLFLISYLFFNLIKSRHLVLIKSFNLVFIYIVMLLAYSFIYIFVFSRTSLEYFYRSDRVFDFGVVLGAAVWNKNEPSPIFQGRLDKAASLFKNGTIKNIFLTGSNAPGELTEASVGKNYLINLDIPSNKIYTEEKTTSTIEQIHFIKNNLISKNESLCVISDAFHLPRVREIAHFIGLDITLIRSNYKLELLTNVWYRIRESILLLIFWLFGI